LGTTGGKLVAVLVAFGLVSCVSAMMWAGPRVGMVMGQDLHGFRFLAPCSASGLPVRAILLQYVIVVLLLATGSFEVIMVYTQVTLVVCSALVVAGVFVLRWKAPNLERPFRCWGYPLTPCLFLAISLFAVGFGILHRPLETLAGLLTIAAGVSLYFSPWVKGRELGRELTQKEQPDRLE
jgi:APA family basic amino acid/polyamine antiporter